MSEWGDQFSKIPSILKLISSSDGMKQILYDFTPIGFESLKESQMEWISIVDSFDNPLEINFFKKYWVPIQVHQYDYFIDLSDENLPFFEIEFFTPEPCSWQKIYFNKNISDFLLKLENPEYNEGKIFFEMANQKGSAYSGFSKYRDKLGFSGKIKYPPFKIEDLSFLDNTLSYTLNDNELILDNVNPEIISLIPIENTLKLSKYIILEKDYEAMIPLIYNSLTLYYYIRGMVHRNAYLAPNYVRPILDNYFEIEFESPKETTAVFNVNQFVIKSTDKLLIKSILKNFAALVNS